MIDNIDDEHAETNSSLISHVNEGNIIYQKNTREIGAQYELGCEIIRKNAYQNNNNDNNICMDTSGENIFDNLVESFENENENIIYDEPNNCITDCNTCFVVY